MAPSSSISNLLQPVNAWLMLITWVYLLIKDKLLVWWRFRGRNAAKRCPRSASWSAGKRDAKQSVCIVTGVRASSSCPFLGTLDSSPFGVNAKSSSGVFAACGARECDEAELFAHS